MLPLRSFLLMDAPALIKSFVTLLCPSPNAGDKGVQSLCFSWLMDVRVFIKKFDDTLFPFKAA